VFKNYLKWLIRFHDVLTIMQARIGVLKCQEAITNALRPACFSLREINQALRAFASEEEPSLTNHNISPDFIAAVNEQGMEKNEEVEIAEEWEYLGLRSNDLASPKHRWASLLRQVRFLSYRFRGKKICIDDIMTVTEA
jgi:hypothetical protein